MLAVVKTRRTDIKIKGLIPAVVLEVLEREYGKDLHLKTEKGEEELIRVTDTRGYKAFKKRMKVGDSVRIYRENLKLTQEELGEKVGHTRSFICDIEKHRRSISKGMAKKFAEIFGTSVSHFV